MNARFSRTTLFTIVFGLATCRAELNWLTDFPTALKQANDQGKVMLIDFTGSDWCGWCIKLKHEVFNQPEFEAFAKENLVLLEVDFPKGKALSASQRTANEKLAARFSIEGFPSVFIVTAQQRPLAKLGYEAGGPANYINTLKKIPNVSWKPYVYEPAGKNAATAAAPKKAAPAPDEPLWGGVVFPPKRYDELKLTGLSGAGARRLAIVNNQTFASGEAARVKLQGGEVKVVCKEIRDNSVIVQVEGASEAKELFLGMN
jgi:thioredoxin-related protein